ncbi:vWA domain-containing protein [Nonomuraea candida]|uniref:vWA domain-containing protein n=1 Tax=Nonomuraea candida TaxID=359159 RepID=UPI000694E1F7|nr:vWA domain-containing protein [Nonomuraea candida]
MRVTSSFRSLFALITTTAVVFVPTAAHAAPPSDVKPVRVVILVDESGSLSGQDVSRERAAAQLIALSELSPRSQVAVVGFGSSNGPGQSAVDIVCPLTGVETAQDRESLSRCVEKLRRREAHEGNDTDHAAALEQALDIMNEPDDQQRAKIVFLLTDGVLDVARSPQYGADPRDRNANARRQIAGTLGDAREGRVQIWPLGFGSADQAGLKAFADGGWREPCGTLESARPRARVVAGSADVERSLLEAFAYARCAGIGESVTDSLDAGATVDLHVTIPAVATDGSIVVVKRDRRIRVGYFDPEGRPVPKQGEQHGSTFQGAGESGPVESLRIRNPVPGQWRIRLESPPGVARQDVSATVVWQGALRASISLSNPRPRPGEQVDVRLRLQTRSGTISDPAELKGLRFSAGLSGEGVPPLPIALGDTGEGPDRERGDGEFSGRVTVPPGATGALSFLGRVTGTGMAGDARVYETRIAGPADRVRAQVRLARATVEPGGEVAGAVSVTSDAGPARLALRLLDAPATVRLSAGELQAPAGHSEHAFTLHVAAGAAGGRVSGTVQVLGPDGQLVADGFVDVDVRPPTPWWQRALQALVIVLAVVAVALPFLLARRRARRRAADPSDLTLHLFERPGEPYVSRLQAPLGEGPEFTFEVANGLLVRTYGTGYAVRRGQGRTVLVRDPQGRELDPLVPGRPIALPNGLWLGVDDGRARGAGDGGDAGPPVYGSPEPSQSRTHRPMPGDDLL